MPDVVELVERSPQFEVTDDEYLQRCMSYCGVHDVSTVDACLAGHRVRLRVTSPELLDLLSPALGWALCVPAGVPIATLTLAVGYDFPPPPWSPADYLDNQRVRGRETGSTLATFDFEHDVMNVFGRTQRHGVFWCADPRRLPEWDISAPLRVLLSWALASSSLHVVHAACVGDTARGGVAICGRGGSGKSTTTLACTHAGLHTTGDDYCILDTNGRSAMHALYALAKVKPDSIGGSFADLSMASAPRSDGKVHIPIIQHLASTLPIRAVVLPTVGPRTTDPVPIDQRTAARRIATATMSQTLLGEQHLLSAVVRLVGSTPCYEMTVGPDLDRVVSNINGLLS